MASFKDLPEEIRLEILYYLDYRSILCLSETCKSLYRTASAFSQVQYAHELALDGMNDSDSNDPKRSVHRLARFRKRRISWIKLAWNALPTCKLDSRCLSYELVAGLFAVSDGQGFHAVKLPTLEVGGFMLQREKVKTGHSVKDFAMDPTQDFVAYLEGSIEASKLANKVLRIHLRTITTDEVHPLADVPHVECPFDNWMFGTLKISATLQINHDLLALFIRKDRWSKVSRVVIWNWNKGNCVYDSRELVANEIMRNVFDFMFLDRTTFLVTSLRDQGSILLFKFSPSLNCFRPSSRPTTSSSSNSNPALSGHVVTLLLPPVKTSYEPDIFTIHSGPICAKSPPDSVFSVDHTKQIQVLSIVYLRKLSNMPVNSPFLPSENWHTALVNDAFEMDAVGVVASHDGEVNGDTGGTATASHPPVITRFTMFIHTQALLEEMQRASRSVYDEDEVLPNTDSGPGYIAGYRRRHDEHGIAIVPWEEWGEHKTRLLKRCVPLHWLRYAHGQKVVSSFHREAHIEVYDFNVTASPLPPAPQSSVTTAGDAFSEHDGAYNNAPNTTITESNNDSDNTYSNNDGSQNYPEHDARVPIHPEVCRDLVSSLRPTTISPSWTPFAISVVTRLPYYLTSTTLPDGDESYYAFMIDTGGLIGLKMDDRDVIELKMFEL